MAPIKTGIIGYGNSARVFHLPYILPNKDIDIIAFFQRTPAPAPGEKTDKKHCKVDFPEINHYTDVESFLGDKDIELVIILTGHDTHAEYAEKSLLAGKHGESTNE
jgi:predicted dehydrogenase